MQGINPETKEVEERKAADDAPFAALAFKIMTDPYVGQLVFLRVYSGTLEAGSGVYNSTKDKKERIGRLLRMHANKREEVEAVAAGDIAAAIGLKLTHDRRHAVRRRSADRARVDDLPRAGDRDGDRAEDASADEEKLGVSLSRLAVEDPTFRVTSDEETAQTLISGHGRAPPRDHRRPAAARVQGRGQRRQAAGRVSRDDPQEGRGAGPFVRQTGGRGQYGDVYLEVEPNEPGKGFEFENKIVGGIDPEGVHSGGREGHPRGDSRPACSPATRSSTSRCG